MSGSLVSAAVLSGVLGLSMTLAAAGSALAQRQAVHNAADAAALAAADALFGFVGGDPCDRAAELAVLAGVRLAECTVIETSVVVLVDRTILGFRVHSAARAGVEF